MTQKLPPDIKKDSEEAFNYFADNKTGQVRQIKSEQLGIVLKSLGKPLPEKKLLAITKKIDENKEAKDKGMINISDFLTAVERISSNVVSEDEMKKVFQVYDVNKDGEIEISELRNTFIGNEEKITDQEIDELLLEADVGGDGKINYEEFKYMMSNSY